MFFHEYRYFFLRLIRNRAEIFWTLLFPIILGTFFHIAFSNITNSTEVFHSIPVSVVLGSDTMSNDFKTTVDSLSKSTKDTKTPMLKVYYDTLDQAQDRLNRNEVTGLLSVTNNDTITLTVSPKSDDLGASILETFVKEYNIRYSAVASIARTAPEKMNAVMQEISASADAAYLKEVTLTNGNMDFTAQYFFNLIAMACLYTSFAGSQIAVKNQANLSPIGARKRVTPTNHLTRTLAELFSCITVQFACLIVNVSYILYVLKVDLGTQTGMVYFTAFIGTILGVSFGFFVGSIGHISEGTKMGILLCVSMVSCFLSGLMLDSMRSVVEKYAPIVNKINPAALISDCFYTLSIYTTYERYTRNIITLLIFSALLMLGGFLIVRREKYASL